jgi:hypothetical protein
VISDAGSSHSSFPAHKNHPGEQFKNKSRPGAITAKQLHQNLFRQVCAMRCAHKACVCTYADVFSFPR